MSPDKEAFLIVAISIASAVAGGFDLHNNIEPKREAIVRDIGCMDLNLSYANLISSSAVLVKASQVLGEPIQNPASSRIIECAKSAEEIVNSMGLQPEGFRQFLSQRILKELGIYGSIGFIAAGFSMRAKRTRNPKVVVDI